MADQNATQSCSWHGDQPERPDPNEIDIAPCSWWTNTDPEGKVRTFVIISRGWEPIEGKPGKAKYLYVRLLELYKCNEVIVPWEEICRLVDTGAMVKVIQKE